MHTLRSICIAASLLLPLPCSLAQNAPISVPALAERHAVERLDLAFTRHYPANQPGAAIIVVKNGTTIFRKAYGLADVATGLPLAPDMLFRLGSVTKQFTATAILMLADAGKLALSDDIRRFLPDFPTGGKQITIEHLLTHTSGIASYTGMPDFGARIAMDLSVAEMIDHFQDQPKLFDAGQRYAYSNSGYFLLGAIIEKVSEQSYAGFLADHVFIPLGMNDTSVEGHERTARRRIPGYFRTRSGFVPSRVISMSQPYAAGALVSTVDDLARWDAAVSDGKLLQASTWEKAFSVHMLNDGKATKYGYGWEIGTLSGLNIISHSGAIDGFSAAVLRIPQEKLYVAVLSNAGMGDNAESVAIQAASIMMNPISD
jgi:D-alanyl-D-alanine carboxypeptidase